MSTSKHIDKICIAVVCLMLALTIFLLIGMGTRDIPTTAKAMTYESTLFDTSYVHKIDIVMDHWDAFIQSCENEEYASCTVVIDGNQYKNTAIRAKGNTSLSHVKSLDSSRYSFKLEFDHYQDGQSCDGLDKLCLNNLIQDNTMMKDYLSYLLMDDFGVDSPLCSFAYITVNGKDWGLYLAVEGIEDSFLSRNYGSNPGELYKPDSSNLGAGPGNGKNFDIEKFDKEAGNKEDFNKEDFNRENFNRKAFNRDGIRREDSDAIDAPLDDSNRKQFGNTPPQMGEYFDMPQGLPEGEMPAGEMPSDDIPSGSFEGEMTARFHGRLGGKGSDDVKLQYIDEDADSYKNIFDNAKTDVTNGDKARLISALKNLSQYTDLENTLEIDEVLRYFVVHSFLVNGDSYTGDMIHNYYLHEKDGKLSMIPWDYNLAFGSFKGGNASNGINDSIDEVLSDRPMQAWIFSDEVYTEQYHALYEAFIEKWFTTDSLETLIADTAAMLHPYVEKDPTKFCSVEEFDKGTETLQQFVTLRGEAVSRQLKGDTSPVETEALNLSAMGSMK